jgi:hypothetical protein
LIEYSVVCILLIGGQLLRYLAFLMDASMLSLLCMASIHL